ncbi:hypothetical protein BC828DRAFT_377036 [Blastocladiella britannica]|nr:hypothetical protein BC828DRAFT_377036 [Blastocladiella britannica]
MQSNLISPKKQYPVLPPLPAVLLCLLGMPALAYLGFMDAPLLHPLLDQLQAVLGMEVWAWIITGIVTVHAVEAATVMTVSKNRGYSLDATATWMLGSLLFGLFVAAQIFLLDTPPVKPVAAASNTSSGSKKSNSKKRQ